MDMKKILQALDNTASKPVGGSDDIKKSLEIIKEGANPHKVSLPVQMAMSHYQKSEPIKETKNSLFKQYVAEAEEDFNAQKALEQQRILMYSRKIANRVMESKRPEQDPRFAQSAIQKEIKDLTQSLEEAQHALAKAKEINRSIRYDDTVTNIILQIIEVGESVGIQRSHFQYAESTIAEAYNGVESAILELEEPFTYLISEIEDRIENLGYDLEDLQQGKPIDLNEGTDFNPPDIIKLDVPLLLRLLEYAKEDAKTDMDLHNVTTMLINLSKEGDILNMNNYDQIVGDQKLLPEPTNEACWKNYKQIGMKKKGKRMVPNCVPKKGK
jgi:hypothetical protein